MRIHSLSIGRPQIMVRGERRVSTAINRRRAIGPVLLTRTGFTGDRVSDESAHGGPDRAACCFCLEHYSLFEQQLGRTLPAPSFGENLTTEGMLETRVCIGDTFRIGGAVVQVSQPRSPCAKLAMKNNEPRLPVWIIERGFTGFYLRVLSEGEMAGGDSAELIERLHPEMPVAEVTRLVLAGQGGDDALRAVAALPELSESFRAMIARRLKQP